MSDAVFNAAATDEARRLLRTALAEDLGAEGDVTGSAVFAEPSDGSAFIVARSAGVVAGRPLLELVAEAYAEFAPDRRLRFVALGKDGTVEADELVGEIRGDIRAILAVERTVLNVLSRLSGTATLTARYVETVRGTKAAICDTRKTDPGMRHLQKYAVRVGGGVNHRFGLHDMALIKDNHLAHLATQSGEPIGLAVQRCRTLAAGRAVEVEIDRMAQLAAALKAGPDIILLDNLEPQALAEAVRRRDHVAPGVLLEASGGIDLTTVRAVAESGVDRISVGALTHSAGILDLGLDYG